MSYYQRSEFISPTALYAEVKEEMRSYFDSTAVDDTLFPAWTNQCLQKMGKVSYDIIPAVINVVDYVGILPDDFLFVREAWMCTAYQDAYQLPTAEYNQILATSTRVDNVSVHCNSCNECDYPPLIQAVYKTTHQVLFTYKKQHLLTPGRLNRINCPEDLFCANFNAASLDSYDVQGNKLVTSFKEGLVYILYYSEQYDNNDNQLIPDTFRIKEFIKAFLKQKIMEQVFNQTADETFNQVRYKLELYTKMSDEAYILADTDNKKEDIHRKVRAVKKIRNRFNKFYIR